MKVEEEDEQGCQGKGGRKREKEEGEEEDRREEEGEGWRRRGGQEGGRGRRMEEKRRTGGKIEPLVIIFLSNLSPGHMTLDPVYSNMIGQ